MSVESASDRKRTSGVIGIMRDNGTTVRWVLSVAILISVANFNIAQAQKGGAVASACGKELITHCSGVPVHANNMLECLRKDQEKLSQNCATLANRVAFRCERDVFRLCQNVVAGQGSVLGCLTKAKRSVSSRCNEALDAAFLR
jgi:hypothetical protein